MLPAQQETDRPSTKLLESVERAERRQVVDLKTDVFHKPIALSTALVGTAQISSRCPDK